MKQHLLNENIMQFSLGKESPKDNFAGNPAQMAAITHESGPVMCLAGPGSGKTFVLTHHIRYLIQEKHIDPYHILVITFSKASAIEMQKRFLDLMKQEYYPVRFGTFHAIFFQILSQYEHYKTSDILTASQKKKYLKTVLLQMNYQGKLDIESMENILSNISYYKNHNDGFAANSEREGASSAGKREKSVSRYEEIEKYIPQFGEIYEKYEKLIRQEHKLDFDDMMLLCHKLLQKRSDILEAYRQEIEYVLIDEYQDINPIQYELVKALIEPHQNLFVVGDDDQSIYGFRGCNPGIMLDFKRHFPSGEIITFPVNYRCTKPIVDAAGKVISKNSKRFHKEISASKAGKESVDFRAFESREAEYEYLINELRRKYSCSLNSKTDLENNTAVSATNLNDCACLFRTNMDASYLAELLMKEKIPYQMKEKPYNPYDHFISRDFLHYLHLKDGDMSIEEFVPVMNRPLRYISREAIDTTKKCVDLNEMKRFYAGKEYMLHNLSKLEYDLNRMKSMDVFAAINYVRKGIGYDDYLRKQALFQNVSPEEYLKMADEIQKRLGMFASLEQLENHIDSYREMVNSSGNGGNGKGSDFGGSGDSKNKLPGVHIMTYHASKGLEFDTVFLPDCNEGNIPYRKSSTPEQIEEERRLFYVAMTRAKERLHIWYLDGEKDRRHLVSRFVREAKGGEKM